MNKNFTSLSKRPLSVEQQTPPPYSFIDDKWPEYVQVQRTQATITGNKIIFNAHSWDPNTFLRSRAYIKLSLEVARLEVEDDGTVTAANFADEDKIRKKPGMVLANSMISQKLTINNNAITQTNPRYWSRNVVTQHVGRTVNDNYLSSSGSSYPYWIEQTDNQGLLPDGRSDPAINQGYDRASRDITVGALTSTFDYMEYVNIGIFNPFADEVDNICKKSWYRKMTPLIPYVRQVGLEIEFKDIAANTLFYRYGLSTQGTTDIRMDLVDNQILSAELVLTWVKPRLAIRSLIPPTIKIQSWFVDHHTFDLVDTATGDATIPYTDGTATIDIQNLAIHQIPTYMMMFATVDKDDPETYACRALYTDSDGQDTDEILSLDLNSNEPYMRPDDQGITVRINILGGDDVIDQAYTDLELYRFTVKNSAKDFPWPLDKFTGSGSDDPEGLFAKYPSEFFLILGEDDLNSFYVRKGQTVNLANLRVSTVLKNSDGYGVDKAEALGAVGGDKKFKFHICFFYDRYYYQLDNCGNVYNDFDARFI